MQNVRYKVQHCSVWFSEPFHPLITIYSVLRPSICSSYLRVTIVNFNLIKLYFVDR